MTFQDVRGTFQKLTADALIAGGIASTDISFDNWGETAGQADTSYAIMTMSFANGVIDTVACQGQERLNGNIQVNINTPKQQGAGPAEAIALEVLKAWNDLNINGKDHSPLLSASTRNIAGPLSLAPTDRPHHTVVVSCSWAARVA